MFRRFEQWAVRTYNPKVAAWKRPALLYTSIAILALCVAGTYAQIEYQWTNDGVWMVIGIFFIIAIYGIGISLWGSDLWVALSMRSL
jgi:hypothetical protein